MSLQAYLDNIKTKTGKTPADFKRLADAKGLLRPGVKAGEVVAWLKSDFGLGRGHALAIVLTLKSATQPKSSADDSIAKHFGGDKARWRKHLRPAALKNQRVWAGRFGGAPTGSYISIVRKGKKFAILQFTAERLDVGIKLQGEPPTTRFEAAGAWNSMVTHRVRITKPKQIDNQVLIRLKRAFDRS